MAPPDTKKDGGNQARKPSNSTGSNTSKSAKNDTVQPNPGAKKPSLKPGDTANPTPTLVWPDGKPILGSDGKPIDPATLTVVVEKDGKSVVNGPDGKPFLLPDGKPLDPALVPPKEPPPPPPKPYLGVPPPRFLRPPWEKSPFIGPPPPQFIPYSPFIMQAWKLDLPSQIEYQDESWGRTMISMKKIYPTLVRIKLGPVGVNFEMHPGPCQCYVHVVIQDIPDYPELVGKSQFSTCKLY